MIVKSLLNTVTKYFSSLSVPSYMGHDKTFLIVADENKKQTNQVIELDATTSAELAYTALPVNVPAETKKAYIDGALVQPLSLTIVGSIEKTKLLEIQKMASADVWVYVLYSKDMGGTISKKGYYANSKLYFIKNLVITDSGFNNSVEVKIQLQEVVLYASAVEYRYGIKQTNPISGDGRDKETKGVGKKDDVPGTYGELKNDIYLKKMFKFGKYILKMPGRYVEATKQ